MQTFLFSHGLYFFPDESDNCVAGNVTGKNGHQVTREVSALVHSGGTGFVSSHYFLNDDMKLPL